MKYMLEVYGRHGGGGIQRDHVFDSPDEEDILLNYFGTSWLAIRPHSWQ